MKDLLTLRCTGSCYVVETYLMRSNSVMSDRSWMARLTGLHTKWGFARQFLRRERDQDRRTVDGEQTFDSLIEGEVYEYRNIAHRTQSGYSYRRSGGYSGFFTISDGQINYLAKYEVVERFAVQQPVQVQ